MIEVRKLNGKPYFLNCELIRTVESTPDTVVTLTSGDKLLVLDPAEEIIRKTIEYRKKLHPG